MPDPEGIQPRWSLKDFHRVSLNSGASATVSFELDPSALEQYNEEGVAHIVPGEYTLYVGNGSPGERSEELGVTLISSTFRVE
jgi:beta-glucosidase